MLSQKKGRKEKLRKISNLRRTSFQYFYNFFSSKQFNKFYPIVFQKKKHKKTPKKKEKPTPPAKKMKPQELTFNPTAVQQTIGLRIMNLPQSCTNELIYTQLFQKLKIDTKKVKAFRVRGHKTQYNCLGDAFVYFDSEDSAQDAMHKIIGYELHGKVLNCSLLMPTSDLKLKNDKNVCVANLSNDVTLKSFYQAMQIHGQVLSVYINEKQNKLGKRSGFASYKTVPFAETAQKEGVTINEKKYGCAVLKKQDKNAAKITQFNPELLSRNIQICFEKPLILGNATTLQLENQLRNQIQTRFGYTPTSVFVWGNRARHMVEQHKRNEKNSTCSALQNIKDESEKQAIIEEENGTKFYTCYKEGQNCSIVQHNRSTAFVCFDHPKHAQGFMNNYYQSCNGQKDASNEAYNFTFKFTNGEETLEVNPSSVRPHLKGDKQKIEEIKEFEQRNLPTASDKSFIFFKNLKKDISIQQLTEAIEKNLEGKAKVISVKMSSPNDETFIRDITKKSTETQFATVHLSDVNESQKLISDFKQNAEFRNKFDLFEGYKYANYLAPKKIHKQELKAKNEKNKRQAQNANKNTNPNLLPMLRLFANNKMVQFNPRMNMPQFPMQPMMFPRFPLAFNNMSPFPNNNKQFQNAPRGQSVPAPQGQFNNNRTQNNNMMNNNNKQNYNNYNNNANRTQSQNRQYNQQQGQQGQQQQRRNPQNFKGTTYPPNQVRQHQQKINPIKPTNAPEKKHGVVQPAQPPKPIVQPAQPPKPIVFVVPKIEEIIGKNDEDKKQILGNCLAPKIQALISEENKIYAPKVTGMLLDFEVYEVQEIIDMLNNTDELKENIDTALELIQESTAQ